MTYAAADLELLVEKYHQLTGHRAAIYALVPTTNPGTFYSAAGDGWIARWDIAFPEEGHLVATTHSQIFSLLNLQSSNLLVAGTMDGGVHWIDPSIPDATRNIAHHKKGTFSFLHLDDFLFSGGGSGMLTRWDISSNRSLESLRITDKSVRCLIHDPKSGCILAGCSDGAIHIVDPKDMSLVDTISNADEHSVFSLGLTPDGKYLISGGRDARLRIMDTTSDHQIVHAIPAHWYTINAIAMHPSLPLFATASRDKTVKIWCAQDFRLLKVLDNARYKGHLNSVNRLLWLSDNILLSAGDDRTIIAWTVNVA